MAYDELTQAQLDRLTEGFKKRIAELEGTISSLDETLETAAAKIESLEAQLEVALRVEFEAVTRRAVAPPHDPTPTPPVPTFSVHPRPALQPRPLPTGVPSPGRRTDSK